MKKNDYDMLREAYDFLNRQMSQFEKTVEIEKAEYTLLKELGRYTGADKIQLTKYLDDTYILVNEWKLNEEFDAKRAAQGLIFINDRNWTKPLQEKQFIYIKDVEDMPDDLNTAYAEMKKEKIHSMIVIPVFDVEKMIAIITICNPAEESVQGVKEIQETLGNWLGCRMVKNDNRVEKTLSGLGGDYTAAYMINVDTDYFEIIINQKSNNVARQKKQLLFTDYLRIYADTYVLEESREDMKRKLCVSNLKKRFEEVDDFHFIFKTVPNSVGQTTFQAHAVKEYGEEGRYAVLGFRCVDDVIKKEREYQEQLDRAFQLARQQLRIITNAIPGGIKISEDDEKYSFKYVSEQYAAMLGYTVEEFMEASGGTIVGIAHPDDLESGIAEALRQYETSDNYAITYRMRCKDGSWKYIEDHGHKVYTEDGKIEHWNLILDKNELVEKTIALESEKKASAAKTAFLARMSHDIRTPLNGIIGLLEINRKHPDDVNLIHENNDKAMVAADHLLSLINDILELNKLGNEEVVLCEEVFSVRKLICEIKTIAEMRAAEEGIKLHLKGKYPQLQHPYIIGSPLHIQQIFINIITNAIKYNKPGGCVDCYFEETSLQEKKVCYNVIIEDTGIGMSREFLQKIFRPFTQEAQDARSVYQGTGLGMSIVKNLIDRMGGTIHIESQENVGTAVYVSLIFPVADEQEKIIPEKDEKSRKDLSGTRVLLVEDNELNREIARFMLEDEKMSVTEAVDGRQAVALFRDNPAYTYDVILMDIMMPVMGGLEAARAIRVLDKEDARSVPIFAMTANAFVEDKKKAYEVGMNEHISKPLDVKILLEKIAEYCG